MSRNPQYHYHDLRTHLLVEAMPNGVLHLSIDDPELWIAVRLPLAERRRLVRYLVGLRDREPVDEGKHRHYHE